MSPILPIARPCTVRVTGDYSKIEGAWPKYFWHRVTFVGDFRKDVEKFAAKIGYTVDYES